MAHIQFARICIIISLGLLLAALLLDNFKLSVAAAAASFLSVAFIVALSNSDANEWEENSKRPKSQSNYDDDVNNLLDPSVHRDEIHQDSNDYQNNNQASK
jgi:hypothetical protein